MQGLVQVQELVMSQTHSNRCSRSRALAARRCQATRPQLLAPAAVVVLKWHKRRHQLDSLHHQRLPNSRMVLLHS